MGISQRRQLLRYQALAMCPRGLGIRAGNTQLVLVLVNPLHADFRAFRFLQRPHCLRLERKIFCGVDGLLHESLNGTLTQEDSTRLFDEVLALARPFLPVPGDRDPRAQQLVELLWSHPKCSISELADHLKLSYGRTSHLFTEAVGIPMRTYRLWQKIYQASAALLAGATVTEAAYAAGFSDAAHYSCAFQRAYGCAPSFIFKNASVKVASTPAGRERYSGRSDCPQTYRSASKLLSQLVQANHDAA